MTIVAKRSTPPFLNSFNASAIILSYVGETSRAIDILNGLSLSTAHYLANHTRFLNQFLFGPRIPTVIVFGEKEKVNLGRNWQKEVVESKLSTYMDCVLMDNKTHFTVNMSATNSLSFKGCQLMLHGMDEGSVENLGLLNTVRSISVKYYE